MRKNKMIFLMMFSAFMFFMVSIGNVYAYTVRFNRAEGNDYLKYGLGGTVQVILKTCTTDESGKLDPSCTAIAYKICHAWNNNSCYVTPGSYEGFSINGYYPVCNAQPEESAISISTINNTVFTSDKDYYCHNGTSQHPATDNIGCYVCSTNSNIMKWDTDGNADDNCSSYTKTDKIETECKPVATPSPTPSPSPSPTPTATPSSACYVCNANRYVMKWKTNGNGDTDCAGGYTKDITIDQANCKNVEPPSEACYVCKADSNYYKWKTGSDGDDGCRGGYNKTTLSKDNCIANPKTGHITAVVVLLIEIAAFFIIFSYVSDVIFKKKKSK